MKQEGAYSSPKKQGLSYSFKPLKLASFLISFILIILFALSFGVCTKVRAAGNIYYVDNTITDTNVASATPDCTNYDPAAFTCSGGTASAFKTIADINAFAALAPGDSVLFRRGQTWREQLTVPSSGSSGSPITFGAYGSGAKPKFLGSIDLSASGAWTSEAVPASGDISSWSKTDTQNKISTSTAADRVGGGYGVANSRGGTSTPAYLDRTFTDTATVDLIFYIKFIDAATAWDDGGNQGITFVKTNSTDRLTVYFKRNGTNVQMYSSFAGDTMGYTTVATTSDTNWHKIEVQVKSDSGGGGYHKVLFDDVSKHNATSLTTTAFTMNKITFAAGGGTSVGTETIYFDDISLTNGTSTLFTDDFEIPAYTLWYATAETDVGSLIFNNEASVGFKKAAKADINMQQGYFWWDDPNNRVYVYSASNPGTYYTHIEAALKPTSGSGIIVISGRDYITIQDLDLRYGGANGINVSGFSSSTDYITVERCNFSYIGGSYESGTTRYGNGIQFYSSSSHVVVRYNSFDDIYDSAITPQAAEASAVIAYHDYYYNVISNTDQSFSIFNSGASSTTSHVNIYNNVFYNNGGGWSHAQKTGYDATTGSAFLIFNSLDGNTSNCNFKNNIVHTSAPQHVYIYDPNDLTGWTIDYNNYYPDGASAFVTASPSHAYTFAQWKSATSQDTNSFVTDPLFVSTSDFHLQSSSPAINTGTDVGLTTDYAGNLVPRGLFPDLGAYEFQLASAPASLAQYKSDGTTAIPSGGWTNQTSAILKFSMSSANNPDSLTPYVEIRTNATPFTDTMTNSEDAVAYSGALVTGSVTVTGLTDGTIYHWQAGAANAAGTGPWTAKGSSPDFGVDTSAPTGGSIT